MSGDTLYWAYVLKGFIEVCLIGAAGASLCLLAYKLGRWLGKKIDGI